MRKLKEFVDANPGESDLSIIKAYLSQAEILPQVPDLLTELLHKQINKLEVWKRYQEEWQGLSFDYYYRDFGIDIASRLDKMSRLMILGKEIPGSLESWAREIVPTLDCPCAIWKDLYEWLHKKGIHFKKEPKSR